MKIKFYNLKPNQRNRRLPVLLALLMGFESLFVSGCSRKYPEVTRSYFALDTVLQITICDENLSTDEKETVLEDCFSLIGHYESILSATRQDSEIYALNHAQGKWVTVSEDTLDVLNLALSFCDKTDGVVDITMESVLNLWDFSGNTAVLPDDNALKEALTHVDYHVLEIDGYRVRLTDPEAQVSLGFIAKGYIAMKVRDTMTNTGVTKALINLGGNIVTLGTNTSGTPFLIGIRDPKGDADDILMTVEATDVSVVTSGNYERCFVLKGERYYHLLDTKTGYPASKELSQVTIIGPDSSICDALSTTLFLLGEEKGSAFLTDYPDYSACFVFEDGNISTCGNFPIN